MDEMIGKQFGYWSVLDDAPSKISPCGTKRKAYLCKCACGKQKIVAKTELKNGRTTSCGCKGVYLREGEIYQEWTILQKDDYIDKHKNQFYLCRCSCGVVRAVRMSDLINGNSKNCGHSRQILSQGAKAIKDFLIQNNIDFYQEYTFRDLKNRRYDFAIFEKANPEKILRLIEFDGEQHCKDSHSSWHTDDLLKKDKEKNEYALSHNIPLIRIPYYKTTITEKDIFGDKFLIEEE